MVICALRMLGVPSSLVGFDPLHREECFDFEFTTHFGDDNDSRAATRLWIRFVALASRASSS